MQFIDAKIKAGARFKMIMGIVVNSMVGHDAVTKREYAC